MRCLVILWILSVIMNLILRIPQILNVQRLRSKLFVKRDDLTIVNFLFMCGHIPAAPAYGDYASQLIRYCWECASSYDLLYRGLLLMSKSLTHGFILLFNGDPDI